MMKVRSAVLGTAVLVVMLTAGAAQSLAGSNTVFSDDIVDGQVAYADIRDNAMTGKKILDNSVTGADVNEASLLLTCGTGLAKIGDVCYTAARNAANFGAARADCLDERLRLPSGSEAMLIQAALDEEEPIVTDLLYNAEGLWRVGTASASGQSVQLESSAATYHCVTAVGARP